MKETTIGTVWVILFKGQLEAVCSDTSTCLRYVSKWYNDRGILPDVESPFSFVKRDIIKLRLK